MQTRNIMLGIVTGKRIRE